MRALCASMARPISLMFLRTRFLLSDSAAFRCSPVFSAAAIAIPSPTVLQPYTHRHHRTCPWDVIHVVTHCVVVALLLWITRFNIALFKSFSAASGSVSGTTTQATPEYRQNSCAHFNVPSWMARLTRSETFTKRLCVPCLPYNVSYFLLYYFYVEFECVCR